MSHFDTQSMLVFLAIGVIVALGVAVYVVPWLLFRLTYWPGVVAAEGVGLDMLRQRAANPGATAEFAPAAPPGAGPGEAGNQYEEFEGNFAWCNTRREYAKATLPRWPTSIRGQLVIENSTAVFRLYGMHFVGVSETTSSIDDSMRFNPAEVVCVRIPRAAPLASGIRFVHQRSDFPRIVVFCPVGSSKKVLRSLAARGFTVSGLPA